MENQLQRLIELQTEQNQLLKRYLWRIRFSLLTLLILTTATCCGLGFVIYTQQRPPAATIAPTAQLAAPSVSPYITPAPTGTFATPGSTNDLFAPSRPSSSK